MGKEFGGPPSDCSVSMFFTAMSCVGEGRGECCLGVRADLSTGRDSQLPLTKGLAAACELCSTFLWGGGGVGGEKGE